MLEKLNLKSLKTENLLQSHDEDIELPPIHILEEEYEALSDIVCGSAAATPGIELLWRELERAVILHTDRPPSGLIHLNSTVHYTDLVDPRHRTVQLVDPGAAAPGHGLSVSSPIGAALIGLQVGDRFQWRSAGDDLRMLRIDRVEYDPLSAARLEASRAADRRRLISELLSAR
jgi:regulator of nucleoside diphosphate kinase